MSATTSYTQMSFYRKSSEIQKIQPWGERTELGTAMTSNSGDRGPWAEAEWVSCLLGQEGRGPRKPFTYSFLKDMVLDAGVASC